MTNKSYLPLSVYIILIIIGEAWLILGFWVVSLSFISIGVSGICFWLFTRNNKKSPKGFSKTILLKLIILMLIISGARYFLLGKSVDLMGIIVGIILIIGVYIYFKVIVPKYFMGNGHIKNKNHWG